MLTLLAVVVAVGGPSAGCAQDTGKTGTWGFIVAGPASVSTRNRSLNGAYKTYPLPPAVVLPLPPCGGWFVVVGKYLSSEPSCWERDMPCACQTHVLILYTSLIVIASQRQGLPAWTLAMHMTIPGPSWMIILHELYRSLPGLASNEITDQDSQRECLVSKDGLGAICRIPGAQGRIDLLAAWAGFSERGHAAWHSGSQQYNPTTMLALWAPSQAPLRTLCPAQPVGTALARAQGDRNHVSAS